FWPLGAALLVRRASLRDTCHVFLLVALVLVPATGWAVGNSMQQPYRQNAPLHLQLEPVAIGPSRGSILLLDARTARYLSDLRASVPGGLERLRGAPMLDFTGAHPGTLFALGGKAIGLPWMIGGDQRSAAVVGRALADVQCEVLAVAWLLTSPDAPQAVPVSLLTRHGIDKYEPTVGSFVGPWLENKSTQHLIPPAADKSAVIARCT